MPLMSMINGLPAHPLLVHFIVVLAPLTAVLAILCAVWPAARQRLVWLVFALAGVTLVVTPIAAEAGEWLDGRVEDTEASARNQCGVTRSPPARQVCPKASSGLMALRK